MEAWNGEYHFNRQRIWWRRCDEQGEGGAQAKRQNPGWYG